MLYLMKEMRVKSEFKLHNSVLYLEKNVVNYKNQKFILSLGYDSIIEDAKPTNALVFKVWDFISLDSK